MGIVRHRSVATARRTDLNEGLEVVLVGSSGGHLAQLMALKPWWERHARTWVTFELPDAISLLEGETTIWAYHPTTRHLGNLFRNLILAIRLLPKLKPDLIVSTGAGVAFPFFVIGKLMGIATCFIEVYDRIDSRTLTGRLCRPFTDVFLVQWENQADLYPGASVIGRLL